MILPGTGVRISGAHAAFLQATERLGIPVAPGWNAQDIVDDTNPCYAGRPGTVGDRAGNFAVQNADVLLVLGCRLNIRQISYNYASFARAAHRIMVDVDAAELAKPTLDIDEAIHADLAEFLPVLLEELAGWERPAAHAAWLARTQEWRRRYPTVLPDYWARENIINPYCFTAALFDQLGERDIIAMADATAAVVTVQAAAIKPGQRLFSNSGLGVDGL